jgi:hypothetical protein
MGLQMPSDLHLRRWMMFVDGENFTIRAQKVADQNSTVLTEGDLHLKNVFVWLPGLPATADMTKGHLGLQQNATRSFYYTSVAGDDVKLRDVKKKIRNLGFHPEVFKKRGDKSKGVDITLSKDLLVHAFYNNYDVAVLVAGDGDYVPLVQEVKRLGKVVYLIFFEHEGLNEDLWMVADRYFEMKRFFLDRWRDLEDSKVKKPSGPK